VGPGRRDRPTPLQWPAMTHSRLPVSATLTYGLPLWRFDLSSLRTFVMRHREDGLSLTRMRTHKSTAGSRRHLMSASPSTAAKNRTSPDLRWARSRQSKAAGQNQVMEASCCCESGRGVTIGGTWSASDDFLTRSAVSSAPAAESANSWLCTRTAQRRRLAHHSISTRRPVGGEDRETRPGTWDLRRR
jgi:hypothetical protein